MATVSLKERMKQLQALKSSVQMKSQAVLAREKELSQIAQQTSVRKLMIDKGSDHVTTGGDTQTTADETATSRTPPLASSIVPEENESKPVPEAASVPPTEGDVPMHEPPMQPTPPTQDGEIPMNAPATDAISQVEEGDIPMHEPTTESVSRAETEETSQPEQVGEPQTVENETTPPQTVENETTPSTEEKEDLKHEADSEARPPTEEDEYEEVEEEDEEEEVDEGEDEDVEIIEETEVVEGDTEGVDIEDFEEYVEVFDDDDDDDDDNEYEEVVETKEVVQKADTERQESEALQITDEKEYDEFAWGRYPVVDKTRPLEEHAAVQVLEQAEEAPMDELEYLRRQSADDSPFDEEASGNLPVFEALDAASQEEGSGVLPVFEALDAASQEEAANDNFKEQSRAISIRAKSVSLQEPKSQVNATTDIESGAVPSRPTRSEGLPPDFNDEGKRKWRFIICCLLVVGACAITALVLPFVLDYNDDRDISNVTPSPTVSPAPTMAPSGTPTLSPTKSPAPTISPSQRPSSSPTLSRSPTIAPSPNPTQNPTIPPTRRPTSAPILVTPAPVTPTSSPISPTRAPVTPTSSPNDPTTLSPTSLRLGNFISVFLVPLSGEAVFEDQNSPQFQAAQYMADEDPFSSELTDETLLAERYAVTTLYFATGGDSWRQCNLGDTTCEGPWLTGSVCSWQYVICSQDGRVIGINFGETTLVGLNGFIPPEISILELLEDFSIIDESVGGTIPESLSLLNATLQFLRLNDNALTGTVPSTFGQLSSLTAFTLQGNNLEGAIDEQICALVSNSLQELSADCLEISCPCCTECFF